MRKPDRPAALTVAAVFLFIYGGLGLCCNGLGVVGAAASAAGSPMFRAQGSKTTTVNGQTTTTSFDTEAEMEKHAPGYKVVAGVRASIGLLLALAALGAGVGVLQMRAWGRYTALAWAALYILAGLVGLVYEVAVLIPANEKVMEAMVATGAPGSQQVASVARPFIYLNAVIILVCLIFPAVSFFLLNGAAARRAFAGLPRRDRDEPEDYHDRRPSRRRDDDDDFEEGYDRPRRGEDEEDEERRRRRRDDRYHD
jgi:hypothetical protein